MDGVVDVQSLYQYTDTQLVTQLTSYLFPSTHYPTNIMKLTQN